MPRSLRPLLLLVLALVPSGCIGNIRDTTTPRTAAEMLLVSTAVERAITQYDAAPLSGRRVFLDDSRFDSVDKNYVVSRLRDHLAAAGAALVASVDPPAGQPPEAGAEVVLEMRNAALAIFDGDFVLGVPQLPVSAQGFPPVLLPPLYVFRRLNQEAYAKLQLWTYEPRTRRHTSRSPDLWGRAYYIRWWWFGMGPFDGSNDIFPDVGLDDLMR